MQFFDNSLDEELDSILGSSKTKLLTKAIWAASIWLRTTGIALLMLYGPGFCLLGNLELSPLCWQHVADMSATHVKSVFFIQHACRSNTLAGNVANMSPTCRRDTAMLANFSGNGMSQQHNVKEAPTYPIYTNKSGQVQVSPNVRVP
jgi:hypothetical protein